MDDDVGENRELQEEELEALEALYEDEFAWPTRGASLPDSHTCTIKVADTFTLALFLPPRYPSETPPIVQIDRRWADKAAHVARITSLLESSFEPGFGVIAEWVEALKELLQTFAQEAAEDEQSDEASSHVENDGPVSPSKETAAETGSDRLDFLDGILRIDSGEPFTDRKSTFQGFVAEVHSQEDVEQLMRQLLSNNKIAKATHNMLAYRIKDEAKDAYIQDCDDDGEHGASSRMLHLLNVLDVQNVAVVVSRWYGGIHLGPDRFKHINNCTRDVLVRFGYHSDDAGKKKKGRTKRK